MDLSVIIIARNEETKIAACIESCLRSIERAKNEGLVHEADVVLSDSASTDRTVEVARRYPITIVRLQSSWSLSAAAGRVVGLRHGRGELVLFVDGDYALFEDWIPPAIRALLEDPALAAVCGRDTEKFTGDSLLLRAIKEQLELATGEPEAIPVGLFRRSALDACGGIHPFLKGAEDRDLVYRLRSAGFRVRRIDRNMGEHHWADEGPLDFVTYFRSVLFWSFGEGQLFRVRRGVVTIAKETRRRYANARYVWNYLLGSGLIVLTLVNLFAAIAVAPLAALAADGATIVALSAARSRRGWSWRELAFQFHAVPYSLFRHAGFVLGFLRPPNDPTAYPLGEEVVQRIRPKEPSSSASSLRVPESAIPRSPGGIGRST